MKHSTDELFSIAYRYYPRGFPTDSPYYRETAEYRRLVEVRKRAGTGEEYEQWRRSLGRLKERLGLDVENWSFHLAAGSCDACYSGKVVLPTLDPAIGSHELGILVSFLAPYFVVYSSRHFNLRHHPSGYKITTPDIGLEFDAVETPYVRAIADWIETSYPGYESMPKEIGLIVIPEIDTGDRPFGEATVYDALFSAQWQARKPLKPDGPVPRAEAGYMKRAYIVYGGDIDDGASTRMTTEIFGGARYLQMLIWAGIFNRYKPEIDERLAELAHGMSEFLRLREYILCGPDRITEAEIGEVTQLRELVKGERWTEAESLARKLYRAVGGEDTEVPAEGWPEALRERLAGEER
jgi:hypothetical protein